jgi:hypothetical protein
MHPRLPPISYPSILTVIIGALKIRCLTVLCIEKSGFANIMQNFRPDQIGLCHRIKRTLGREMITLVRVLSHL